LDKRRMFGFIGTSADPSNLSDEERRLHERRNAIRIASVVIVLLCTLFLAVAAGTMIALWDSGKTARELIEVMNGTYVYAKTQEELERLQNEEEAGGNADTPGLSVVNDLAEGDETDNNGDGSAAQVSGTDGSDQAEIAKAQQPDPTVEGIQDTYDMQGEADSAAADGTDATLLATSGVNVYIDPDVNYPLPFTTVDESYFEDALFIGDSRLQGFGMYSGLPGTYYAATGFQLYKYDSMKVVNTDSGKVPIFSAMPYDTFSKIYIKVGLNEMGGNDNVFKNKYAELIAQLRESEPRAIIYVHGILPVTAAKSQSDKVHSNANVTARNETLKQIAEEQRAYYLDVGSVFMGADGFLPPEMAADGIHLKAQYMDKWKQYLMEHAVVLQ
jgi:lysophospholipase L1-like esterase